MQLCLNKANHLFCLFATCFPIRAILAATRVTAMTIFAKKNAYGMLLGNIKGKTQFLFHVEHDNLFNGKIVVSFVCCYLCTRCIYSVTNRCPTQVLSPDLARRVVLEFM